MEIYAISKRSRSNRSTIHLSISQENDPQSEGDIPVLSSYTNNLESHVGERYLKNISVVGVDPAAIPSEQFSSECLPPIEVSDLLSYRVLETSYYTNKQFKAFKSLKAYNQMVSGFVASVQGKEIADKIVVFAKVRRHHYLCALLRLQGRTGGIVFPCSERDVLHRSCDTDSREACLYSSEMHMDFTNICQRSAIWKGKGQPFHQQKN